MLTLKKIQAFICKYWKLFALAAGAIIGFLLFKREGSSFADDYMKIKKIEDEKIKKIEAIHQQQVDEKKENLERYEEAVKVIKKEAVKNNSDLDRKQKKRIKEIVKKPIEVQAKELADLMGFDVVLPEKK